MTGYWRLVLLIWITINIGLAIVPSALYVLADTTHVTIMWERVMLAYAVVTFVDAMYIAHRMMDDIGRGHL